MEEREQRFIKGVAELSHTIGCAGFRRSPNYFADFNLGIDGWLYVLTHFVAARLWVCVMVTFLQSFCLERRASTSRYPEHVFRSEIGVAGRKKLRNAR